MVDPVWWIKMKKKKRFDTEESEPNKTETKQFEPNWNIYNTF